MKTAVLLMLAALPLAAADKIGLIEFFGHKGIDVEAVRKALPAKVGDPFSFTNLEKAGETIEKITDAVVKTTGREPTDISSTCCIGQADWIFFIGLAGDSTKPFPFNPPPQGSARLPAAILEIDNRFGKAWMAAIQKGGENAAEDRSQGYSLLQDPTTRALQLEIRAWTLEHEEEVYAALESSDAPHRDAATTALGYVRQTPRQIEALLKAARDPSSEVRNNATRALDVLLQAYPTLAESIDPSGFIAMIQSGIWTDRNKGSWALELLTASKNPQLLARLRVEAMDALTEMAAWKSHGDSARTILERIAAAR